MNILVSGGAGFIGSNLVKKLSHDEGNKIIIVDCLDRDSHGDSPTIPEFITKDNIEFYKRDIRERDFMETLLRKKKIDIVYHLAAKLGISLSFEKPSDFIKTNTLGTEALLYTIGKINKENHNQIKHFILASSNTVYGEGAYHCDSHGKVYPRNRDLKGKEWCPVCPICKKEIKPIPTDENSPLYSKSIYAETKREQEALTSLLGEKSKINITIMRFFNVYGPGQSLSNPYTGVASIFLNKYKNGEKPLIFEDGKQLRDFIFIEDLVLGLEAVMGNKKAFGEIFNLGTGKPTSITELAETIAKSLGFDKDFKHITYELRKGDIRNCYADVSKIKRIIGFTPRHSLKEGIKKLIEWSKEE